MIVRANVARLVGLPAVLQAAVRRGRVKTAYEAEAHWKERARVKTGRYRGSIHTDEDATPTSSVVGTDLTDPLYPFYLEFGTRYMRAYPAATPAAEYARRRFGQNVADEVAKALAA
jgi:hypothetical protein